MVTQFAQVHNQIHTVQTHTLTRCILFHKEKKNTEMRGEKNKDHHQQGVTHGHPDEKLKCDLTSARMAWEHY